MSRKDYEFAAKHIKAQLYTRNDCCNALLRQLAESMADDFAKDNDRFNLAKFFKACGF